MDAVDDALKALGAISLLDFTQDTRLAVVEARDELKDDSKADVGSPLGDSGDSGKCFRGDVSTGSTGSPGLAGSRHDKHDDATTLRKSDSVSSPGLPSSSTTPSPPPSLSSPAGRLRPAAMGKTVAASTALEAGRVEEIHVACQRARPYALEAVWEFTAESKSVFGANLAISRLPSALVVMKSGREDVRLPILFYSIRPSLPSKKMAKILVAEKAVAEGVLDKIRKYGVYGECEGQLSRDEARRILAEMNELGGARRVLSSILAETRPVEGEAADQAYVAQPSHFISKDQARANAEAAAAAVAAGEATADLAPESAVGELFAYCTRMKLGTPQFIQGAATVHVEMSPVEMAAQKHLTGRLVHSTTRLQSLHTVSVVVDGKRYENRHAYHKVKEGKEKMAKAVLAKLKTEKARQGQGEQALSRLQEVGRV